MQATMLTIYHLEVVRNTEDGSETKSEEMKIRHQSKLPAITDHSPSLAAGGSNID